MSKPQLRMMTMIDYKASGTLVASALLCADIHIVIVWRGSDYVVSKYESGCSEWRSGNYYNDYNSALTKFMDMISKERQLLGANGCSHL